MGGMVAAIERGYPQKEIAESAYRFQQAVEQRDRIIVGVNAFVEDEQEPVGILYIDESVAQRQLARLEHVRDSRDNDRVRAVAGAAAGGCAEPATTRCRFSSTRCAPTPP